MDVSVEVGVGVDVGVVWTSGLVWEYGPTLGWQTHTRTRDWQRRQRSRR